MERYRPLFELASGGMGRVDLCLRHKNGFERLYAVKRLHPHFRDDASFLDMFRDEARLAGLIRHSNVVSVLDVGEDAEGPFLVMDFVDGVPLSEIIGHHRRLGQPVPMQLALRIVSQAAAGLHAAHELARDGKPLGLVHRDVSPQNILVGYDGTVRVTDFGVAKALGRSAKTATGVLKGKISYMAPEQLKFQEPDRRSDLFSLGVILYELVANEHPFGNDPSERARNILASEVPDLGEVREDAAPQLVELVYELLADNTETRPASAAAVKERIDEANAEVIASEGILPVSDYVQRVFVDRRDQMRTRIDLARLNPAPQASSAQRSPLVWALAATVVGVVLVGVGGWSAGWFDDEMAAAPEPSPIIAPAPAAPAALPEVQPAATNEEPVPTKMRARGMRDRAEPQMRRGPPVWQWE